MVVNNQVNLSGLLAEKNFDFAHTKLKVVGEITVLPVLFYLFPFPLSLDNLPSCISKQPFEFFK